MIAWLRQSLLRLTSLFRRAQLDRDLDAEIASHLELAIEENLQHGMSDKDARRQALIRFGGRAHAKEQHRDSRGLPVFDALLQDLRFGLRILRKNPGFTVAAVLTLALGIGVNVAVFGFFNLLVLRPLPVRDPATILRFLRSSPDNFSDNLPYPAMAFYREHCKTLSAVLALNSAKLAIESDEKQITAHFVTSNYFSELGTTAISGRLLDPARDQASDAEPAAVLAYGFWRRHFGADPLVVGKTIRLNGKPVTIIGVASAEFSGLVLDAPDLWLPLNRQPYFVDGSQLLTDFSEAGTRVEMWGRLQPGLTPKVAEQELGTLVAELRRQHPNDIWEKESLSSEPGGYAKNTMGGAGRGVSSLRSDGGPGPADSCRGMWQSGQLAAGAWRGKEKGDRDSRRCRGWPQPADSPTIYGKPVARPIGIAGRAGTRLRCLAEPHGLD